MEEGNMKKINKQEVIELLAAHNDETRVYFGCDSTRFKNKGKWFAKYTTVLVVHKDGCHGCKIFHQTDTEADYDQKASRPFTRMMNEAYRVTALCLEFMDIVTGYDVEVHLDINKDDIYGSSVAVQAAGGYVQGLTNIVPMFKPSAYAASYAADRGEKLG
jgi:predicted RNase H-related nuclease YkuK (DUF458 family)